MATDLPEVFAALADPTRLRVVDLLRTRAMRAGALSEAARVSRPAMSRHLRVLLEAGVIEDERSSYDARLRVFRLRPEGLAGLETWLARLRADWDRQLASFERHVERQSDRRTRGAR